MENGSLPIPNPEGFVFHVFGWNGGQIRPRPARILARRDQKFSIIHKLLLSPTPVIARCRPSGDDTAPITSGEWFSINGFVCPSKLRRSIAYPPGTRLETNSALPSG